MSEQSNPRMENLRRLNAEIRRQLEVAEMLAGELNEIIARLVVVDHWRNHVVLARAVRIMKYEDPQLDDSGQVWMPALRIPDGLGMVLADLNEFGYLAERTTPLETALNNQFMPYEDCTAAMRLAIVDQIPCLLDRLSAAFALGQS